ncbi:FtsX-like permease family protein, partial [Streptosporangium sp. NPDC048047]|uniref:FtsX-like permease family protein n=1 Tax=Streptosporangium sp. NPDC048047 TaxID=3155748 RepID=UPI003423B5A6
RAGRPILGAVLVVAGAVAVVLAIRFRTTWVLVAAVPALLGLITLTPSLVRGGAALAARTLSLPLRLAARDAARNRGRTAAAVAAVMTATAACTVAAVMVASGFAARSASYHAALPEGTTTVTGLSFDNARWAQAKEVAGRRSSGAPPIEAVAPRDVRGTRVEIVTRVSSEETVYGRHYHRGLPVGDGRLLALVQGREDPVAAAAFAAGKAVVFDPDLVRDGRLRLIVRSSGRRPRGIPADPAVPAVVARAADPRYAVAVLPVSALPALGLKPLARVLYLDPAVHRLGPAERTRLERELAATAGRAEVITQGGLGAGVLPQLVLLLTAAAVLALGGTLAATGLAAADLRPDLATMAAVGAKPGTRRLVVAGQAAFITALGAPVGVLQGVAVGVAALWPVLAPGRTLSMPPHQEWLPPFPTEPPVVAVPWTFLTVLVVGLPLLAALVAGAFTRTRVILTRRIT